jgi:hypothetical protein
VPGIDPHGQRTMAGFLVLLGRLLLVKCACGILIGLYAMALPAEPGGGPPILRSAGGILVPVLLCVLGGAVVWTAWAFARMVRAVAYGGPPDDDVAVVPRKPGGRRSYDQRPDEQGGP